jgi:predicted dehydrogenase
MTNDGSRRKPVGVAVIGCGYWGPNLIRNFLGCDAAALVAVCDRDPRQRARMAGRCGAARLVERAGELLADPRVEAVAIATPVHTHARLALAALEAGKHVLVEKPMADNVADAQRMVQAAADRGRTLMVDHVFLYSPAVRKIKELIAADVLGEIYYIDSVRINLGLIQQDVNVLWDLAPHDLSIVDHLLGRLPLSLAATGAAHTGSGLEDVAHLSLDYGENLIATFHVNWLSPVKLRHMIVGGRKKSVVYNDLDGMEPVKVYDRGIDVVSSPQAKHGLLVSYRSGDVWSPCLPPGEPLGNVVRHFLDCIRDGRPPLSDGASGLRIVRILEAAQQSIQAQSSRIAL